MGARERLQEAMQLQKGQLGRRGFGSAGGGGGGGGRERGGGLCKCDTLVAFIVRSKPNKMWLPPGLPPHVCVRVSPRERRREALRAGPSGLQGV